MIEKGMLGRVIESLLSDIVGRNVEVSFSHLGGGKDYVVSIQTTLYEFDDGVDGPLGPMYVTFNNSLLQGTSQILTALNEIVAVYKVN